MTQQKLKQLKKLLKELTRETPEIKLQDRIWIEEIILMVENKLKEKEKERGK